MYFATSGLVKNTIIEHTITIMQPVKIVLLILLQTNQMYIILLSFEKKMYSTNYISTYFSRAAVFNSYFLFQ